MEFEVKVHEEDAMGVIVDAIGECGGTFKTDGENQIHL
jgi:hypothetical protein